jgi:hypothetical protein
MAINLSIEARVNTQTRDFGVDRRMILKGISNISFRVMEGFEVASESDTLRRRMMFICFGVIVFCGVRDF